MYGQGMAGLGSAYVPTALDPSDPTNPNRALYMEASSGAPFSIADALNSGDPYTMQRALDNMFWWPADAGHHAGLMVIQGLELFTPAWFKTLNAQAQSAVIAGMQAAGFGAADIAGIQGAYIPNQVDPNAIPPGWLLGSAHGTNGYWSPDGKFYAGTTPWLDPNAVGQTLAEVSPPPAQGNANQGAPVQTNPDGTPTYNGQKYSATDTGNPYNQAGYVPGGQVGPAVPGGSVSGPFVPTGLPGDTSGNVNAPAQASVLGGMSSSTLLIVGGGLLVGLLLLRRKGGGAPST